MKNNSQIRVRIAPSPTGNLHVGTTRTALFNYLFAKKNNGDFIIRIEDTDKERSTPEFEKNILEGLERLGMGSQEIYRQSERTDIYKKYLKQMIDTGHAYESKEEVKEEGQRSSVIRFKNPNKVVTFVDMIRGEISFDTTDLGDFVIAKSMEEPLYHLAVVVDDFDMKISHVIRGEDHISNTPRQILIQEVLKAPKPLYAHLPLILTKEKKKMSKRDGATSMMDYINKGYLQSTLINFLAFLGWHPEGEREVFTLEELVEEFDITRVQKGGAIFDTDKLDWFNKEHIKKISDIDFQNIIKESAQVFITNQTFLTLIRERITVFGEISDILKKDGEFGHLLFAPEYSDITKVIWKDSTVDQTKEYVSQVILKLETINGAEFNAEKTKEVVWEYATEQGRGAVLWPTRYILSGQDKSPDPFTIMEILGKEESLIRLHNGIEIL